jgi:hypothetical protein
VSSAVLICSMRKHYDSREEAQHVAHLDWQRGRVKAIVFACYSCGKGWRLRRTS